MLRRAVATVLLVLAAAAGLAAGAAPASAHGKCDPVTRECW